MQWPKQRAWGWYATLIRTPWFCVKLLRFRPFSELSLQRHKYRTEIWIFIKGRGLKKHNKALGDAAPFLLWKIMPNEWHKFKSYGVVYAIELQYGRKVTENDIERK